MNSARNAVKANDLDAAIERFHELLRLAPDSTEARIEYAGLLFRTGRVREALPQYERLLQERPDDPELTRLFVDALLNLGDHPRAKTVLLRGLSRWPDRADFSLRLAKLYALDREFGQARDILHAMEPSDLSDDEIRLDAAELYLQLKDAAGAWGLLEIVQASYADSPRFLAAMVRHRILVGNGNDARHYVERLNAVSPRDIDLRLELAEALYAAGYHPLAGELYRAVLEVSPAELKALLGATRVALRDDHTELAEAYLQRVPPAARSRLYLLVVAETRTISGRYVSAKHVLQRLAAENPDDIRAQLALGTLDRAELEFRKADTRYIDLIQRGLAEHEARLRWAESLALQHKFGQSANVCREVLAKQTNDVDANVLLARNLVDLGHANDAIGLLDALELPADLTPVSRSRLLTAAGEAFLALGKYPTARDAFESAIDLPGGENARARFGLYRIELRAGHSDAAWRQIEEGIQRNDFPVHCIVEINDLAMKRGHRPLAARVLAEGLRRHPDNIVLLIRHAEWYGSFSVNPWANTAVAKYRAILKRQPDNNKSRLGLARALASARCYGQALDTYARLHREQPWNLLIAREEARLERHVCDLGIALDTYDHNIIKREGWAAEEFTTVGASSTPNGAFASTSAPDVMQPEELPDILLSSDSSLDSPDSSPSTPLRPISERFAANARTSVDRRGTELGQAEFGEAVSEYGSPNQPPPRPLADTSVGDSNPVVFGEHSTCRRQPWALPMPEARFQESDLLDMERSAKIAQNPNPSCARDIYCQILEEEPHEQHIWFELGQTYGALGRTCQAIDCYEHILCINPNHRDAKIALAGKIMETRPYLDAGYDFQHFRGRDGLADIDFSRAFLGYTWQNPAHEQVLGIRYSLLHLTPHHASGTAGHALGMFFQRRWDVHWPGWIDRHLEATYLFANAEVQKWDRWVSTRPVFDAGIRVRTRRDAIWTLAGTMSNVLANPESLRQDIYRGGLRVGVTKRIGERWETGLEYAFREYSDDNREHIFDFRNRLALTRDPCQWALLADYRFWHFDEPSVFNAIPTDLVGMRHPYFTPDAYSQADVGIEYKRTLSCDRFDGAHPSWYSASYRSRWDSEGEHYNIWNFRLHWDINCHLKAEADATYTDSPVYEHMGARGRLIWVF